MLIVVAAISVGLCVWLALPEAGYRRLLPNVESRTVSARSRFSISVAVIGFAGIVVLPSPTGSAFWCIGVVAITAVKVGRDHWLRSRLESDRREVARGCSHLSGLIRIGFIPTQALRLAAKDLEVFRMMSSVSELGGDVAEAFLAAGRNPGAEGLIDMGRAWRVSERTGASLLSTLSGVVMALEERQRLGRMVQVELSAPRASGRLMAALPFVGLLFGYGFGGDPVAFLLSTWGGRVCLLVGVGLAASGLLWSEHLAERAESL